MDMACLVLLRARHRTGIDVDVDASICGGTEARTACVIAARKRTHRLGTMHTCRPCMGVGACLVRVRMCMYMSTGRPAATAACVWAYTRESEICAGRRAIGPSVAGSLD